MKDKNPIELDVLLVEQKSSYQSIERNEMTESRKDERHAVGSTKKIFFLVGSLFLVVLATFLTTNSAMSGEVALVNDMPNDVAVVSDLPGDDGEIKDVRDGIAVGKDIPDDITSLSQATEGDAVVALEEPADIPVVPVPTYELEDPFAVSDQYNRFVDSLEFPTIAGCGDQKDAALTATQVGSVLFAIIGTASGFGAPVAIGGFLGYSNSLISLWKCPGFSIGSYKELASLVNGLIVHNSAKEIANSFQDIMASITICGLQSRSNSRSRACRETILNRLESEVTTKSLDPDVVVVASRIFIAAILQYSTIMQLKMLLAIGEDEIKECENEWAPKYVQEIQQIIDRISNAYNKVDSATSDLRCTFQRWKLSPTFTHPSGCGWETACEAVPEPVPPFNELGVTWAKTTLRWNGWYPGNCGYKNNFLAGQIRKDYRNSKMFDWWRTIEPDFTALRASLENVQTVKKLCGRGICGEAENTLGCSCNNDNMCSGGLTCNNNICDSCQASCTLCYNSGHKPVGTCLDCCDGQYFNYGPGEGGWHYCGTKNVCYG